MAARQGRIAKLAAPIGRVPLAWTRFQFAQSGYQEYNHWTLGSKTAMRVDGHLLRRPGIEIPAEREGPMKTLTWS